MVKTKKIFSFSLGVLLGVLILTLGIIFFFEKKYQGKIYPGVKILGYDFGGKKKEEVVTFLKEKNLPFENLVISFFSEDKIATLSGKSINLGFDGRLTGQEAFSLGRSGSLLFQILTKWQLLTKGVNLSPFFRWERKPIEESLEALAKKIDLPAKNALFKFESGKVRAFKPSEKGRRVNREKTIENLEKELSLLFRKDSSAQEIKIPLQVEVVEPEITTEEANNLGIEELLGKGVSYFEGSSKERVHNITLASSLLNGVLIAPKEVFSFNQAIGEISSATGYKSSYIIKEGRTILGDGGGVCQVSTTLFRAALASGLEILERHPHSYRVYYYEQGGFSPGIDATVFAPDIDLKIKNNTQAYVLIESNLNLARNLLVFNLYGKNDGRKVEISEIKVWDQKPPPEDKYIDDPALPKGEIKQIDWKAWGAKTSFNYKVTRNGEVLNGEVLEERTFNSNFLPWQAVFLRGTKE